MFVSSVCGIPVDDIIGRNRHSDVVKARAITMWILRNQGYSLKTIGKAMKRTHADVIHNIRLIDGLLQYPKQNNDVVAVIFKVLNEWAKELSSSISLRRDIESQEFAHYEITMDGATQNSTHYVTQTTALV